MDYFLPQHVYFCTPDDKFVFLDLRKDEYTMLEAEQAGAFASLLQGDGNVSEKRGSMAILRDLAAAGLLTIDKASGKPVAPSCIEWPTAQLQLPSSSGGTAVHIVDLWRFLVACTIARVSLRFQNIEAVVRRVAERKQARDSRVDRESVERLVGVFTKLRSIFPVNYLCLYDSLALIEFLACYGVFPAWVFAVRLAPWGAHCWVQDGIFALNEDIETTESYIPIMAV